MLKTNIVYFKPFIKIFQWLFTIREILNQCNRVLFHLMREKTRVYSNSRSGGRSFSLREKYLSEGIRMYRKVRSKQYSKFIEIYERDIWGGKCVWIKKKKRIYWTVIRLSQTRHKQAPGPVKQVLSIQIWARIISGGYWLRERFSGGNFFNFSMLPYGRELLGCERCVVYCCHWLLVSWSACEPDRVKCSTRVIPTVQLLEYTCQVMEHHVHCYHAAGRVI